MFGKVGSAACVSSDEKVNSFITAIIKLFPFFVLARALLPFCPGLIPLGSLSALLPRFPKQCTHASLNEFYFYTVPAAELLPAYVVDEPYQLHSQRSPCLRFFYFRRPRRPPACLFERRPGSRGPAVRSKTCRWSQWRVYQRVARGKSPRALHSTHHLVLICL